MSQNILVLDLETQKSFKEVGKSRALEKLKISVVGVYDYMTDEYRCYEEREMMELEKRLRAVDLLIGFNIRRFDLPVLAPYIFTPVEQIPCLDLLEDIEQARGHRASLDSLARPTLNQHKSGSGRDALELFKENRWDELKKYCLDDVRLTKAVYEYGVEKGKVLFTSSWDYKTYEVPVKWKAATEEFLSRSTGAKEQSSFPSSLF